MYMYVRVYACMYAYSNEYTLILKHKGHTDMKKGLTKHAKIYLDTNEYSRRKNA